MLERINNRMENLELNQRDLANVVNQLQNDQFGEVSSIHNVSENIEHENDLANENEHDNELNNVENLKYRIHSL